MRAHLKSPFSCSCWYRPKPRGTTAEPRPGLDRVEHVIVIFLENRSFDHLYGLFPGADGLGKAAGSAAQVAPDGERFDVLPVVLNNYSRSWIDPRFSEGLPNRPFREDRFVNLRDLTGDPVHRFYQEQEQINGGKMNQFVAYSDVGSLPMGYFDGHQLPLFRLAQEFTLADHFFHAAFGGGLLNHMWLICACAPRYDNAPAGLVAQLDAHGRLISDGAVTPDGFAVDTIQPRFGLHDPAVTGERLSVTAADDANDWTASRRRRSVMGMVCGWLRQCDLRACQPEFRLSSQPFAYFADYANGTAGTEHLKDESDMLEAIEDRTLPAVSFYKPLGTEDEHPGYADLLRGDNHAAWIIRRKSGTASSGMTP